MQVSHLSKEENSPWLQLVLLLVYAVVGVLVFAAIGMGVVFLLYGVDPLKGLLGLQQVKVHVPSMKILLTAQQIGLFLAPAIFLSLTEGKKPQHFYGLAAPKINWVYIVLLIMICSFPILGLVNELNQKMHLPSFLKSVEDWMRRQEDEGLETTKLLLQTKTIFDFLINLSIVAILPAVCEEFFFRAGLQRTLLRWIKNPHVAIWLSAIIFSAIHVQFFGFFPRLFLGAAFGYIYFWTGSLWYTVIAHFLNNGFAVAIAWYMQRHNLPMDKEVDESMAWYVYVISAILTIALFKYLKNETSRLQTKELE